MRHIETRRRPAIRRLGIALVLAIAFGASFASAFGQVQDIEYGIGKWDPESGLGNHRVVVRVEAPPAPVPAKPDKAVQKLRKRIGPPLPPAAVVRIDWRRRDAEPEKKNVIVVDAATGERVAEVLPVRLDNETGEFLFKPKTVPGDYYFYFLPYKSEGRKNYPNVKYDPPAWSSDPDLTTRAAGHYSSDFETSIKANENLLRAEVVEFQSADAFGAFTPMEIVARSAERQALLAAHPGAPYLLFPEDRSLSIRMADALPYRWISKGPQGAFRGEAARGEYFTFQIGVWAARGPIADLEVKFSDLVRTEAKIDGVT
ncbi:MAG TPA: glycoside hydrolase domain-containing protein, partial [Acidobacteriota bacterium]|nr:glycoside hydrolase domain-containing protein [Acidobacteriota bacterium]